MEAAVLPAVYKNSSAIGCPCFAKQNATALSRSRGFYLLVLRSKMRLHFFLYKALYMEKYKFARKFCQNSVYIIVITNKYEGAKNLWNKDGGGKEENMSEGLLKIFIKDYKNVKDIKVRENYGIFAGIVGIICNLILFACKFFAGIITSSVSISADAFNNLSDAGSSIVTLAGFKMAGKPADTDHPFGLILQPCVQQRQTVFPTVSQPVWYWYRF